MKLKSVLMLLLLSTFLLFAGCSGVSEDPSSQSSNSSAPASSVASTQSSPGKGKFTGVWQRTDIPQSQAATVTIKDETKTSFFFSVHTRNGGNVGSTEGVAHLITADRATCTYNSGGGATVTFTVKDGILSISVSDHTPLGFGKGVTMDGSYLLGTPNYREENWASEVFNSTASTKAEYPDLLDKDANAFLDDVLKDGTLVNQYEVDTPSGEMYRFAVQAAGLGADVLRTDDGKIFVGLVGYEDDYMLYTNHPDYKKKAPAEYQDIAADPIQVKYIGE